MIEPKNIEMEKNAGRNIAIPIPKVEGKHFFHFGMDKRLLPSIRIKGN